MKVKLTPIPKKEKIFEPFSVTFTFETEQEACDMWHRLNKIRLDNINTKDVRLGFLGESESFDYFNRIMFDKGLSTYNP